MSYCEEDYQSLILSLHKLADADYKKFNERLIPGLTDSLGVRLPQLRKLAHEILKEDWRAFLVYVGDETFEEIMLQGLVIASAPCDFAEKWNLTQGFVPKINNWAVCDTFCASFKDIKKYRELVRQELNIYIVSEKEFERRFAIIILMDYFLLPEYIDDMLDVFREMNCADYYCGMGLAWALSVCYIKFPTQTLVLLQERSLAPAIQNKTIQKLRESYRISAEVKDNLKQYKIKE